MLGTVLVKIPWFSSLDNFQRCWDMKISLESAALWEYVKTFKNEWNASIPTALS